MRSRTQPTLIDLTAHPKNQPLTLPRRGPLALRYIDHDGRLALWPRVSRPLAETVLKGAGYQVAKE